MSEPKLLTAEERASIRKRCEIIRNIPYEESRRSSEQTRILAHFRDCGRVDIPALLDDIETREWEIEHWKSLSETGADSYIALREIWQGECAAEQRASILHDEIHDKAALVDLEGHMIGWAPEDSIPMLASALTKYAAEMCAAKDAEITELKATLTEHESESWRFNPLHEQECIENARLREALLDVRNHLSELREAWERGALGEYDGLGGTRSNRNADALTLIDRALTPEPQTALVQPAAGEAIPQMGDRQQDPIL